MDTQARGGWGRDIRNAVAFVVVLVVLYVVSWNVGEYLEQRRIARSFESFQSSER